jgi:hypothetical protein
VKAKRRTVKCCKKQPRSHEGNPKWQNNLFRSGCAIDDPPRLKSMRCSYLELFERAMDMKFRVVLRATFVAASALLPCVFWQPASAALGGDLASVQADQAHMKRSIRTSHAPAYTRHEIESSNHVVVREYMSAEGKVFGVAWNGQFRPDLQQILGTYFDQFSQAVEAQRAAQPGRHPITAAQPGLFVEMGGHMRALSGRAYIPDMSPQSVRAEEVR